MAKRKSSKSKAKKPVKSGKKPIGKSAGKAGSAASAKKKTTSKPETVVEPSENAPPKISRQTKTLPRMVSALNADYSQILAMRNVRWMIVILAVLGALFFGYWLSEIFVPLLVAVGISYILNPIVERIERRGVTRTRAVAWIFLSMLVGLIAFGSWFGASVVKDVRDMHSQLGGLFNDAEANSDEWVASWNSNTPDFMNIDGDNLTTTAVIQLAKDKFTPSQSSVESTNKLQTRASMASARAELLKSFQVFDIDRDLKLESSEIDGAELKVIDANGDGHVGTSEWFSHFGVVENLSNKRVPAPDVNSSASTIFDFVKSGLIGMFYAAFVYYACAYLHLVLHGRL